MVASDPHTVGTKYWHQLDDGRIQCDLCPRCCKTSASRERSTPWPIKHQTEVWFELTTLRIPGENDSDNELHEMTRWVVEHLGPDVPMHFPAFHPDFRMLDKPSTPPATLARARRIAMENGIRYAYVGNVHDAPGDSTYSHQCGKRIIGRDWYVLTAWQFTDDGCCRSCEARCAGFFAGPPGNWSARRAPVRMQEFA